MPGPGTGGCTRKSFTEPARARRTSTLCSLGFHRGPSQCVGVWSKIQRGSFAFSVPPENSEEGEEESNLGLVSSTEVSSQTHAAQESYRAASAGLLQAVMGHA